MNLSTRLRTGFANGLNIAEKFLLLCIIIATVVAILIEIRHVVTNRQVLLSDILLLFLYLEVLAMSRLYIEQGRVPVRYPIYIAIIAMARYLTLAMSELPAISLMWIALSMLLMVCATLVLRFGHNRFPYVKQQDTEPESEIRREVYRRQQL